MKMKAVTLSMLSAGLLMATVAQADETTYTFGGFGTLSGVHSGNRDFDFRGSIAQPNGVGRTRDTSFGIDTKLGLQGAAQFNKNLSAVVQVVVDRRAGGNYLPRVEWANLKYQVNDDLSVRLGRVVAPVFMVSDYRNVGYAQTMVRMPYEVYGQNPISHLDGVEINYKLNLGPGTLTTGLTAGHVKENLPDVKVTGSSQLLNFTYEVGSSTIRLGATKTDVDVHDGTVPQIEALAAAGALVGHPQPTLITKGMKTTLLDLGYLFDDGRWIAQAEFVRSRPNVRTIKKTDTWYVMGGYRIGSFTPYVSYAQVKDKSGPLNQPVAASNPFCEGLLDIPTCMGLAYGTNLTDASTRSKMEQKTFSAGVRYDVMKNLALKFQYDHTRKPGSASNPAVGMLMSPSPVFPALYAPSVTSKASINMATVSLDFIF
jgi:opacity protein-like surface antigen